LKPLIVYFQKETYFGHSRRVYIAARSKAAGHRMSRVSAEALGYGQSQVVDPKGELGGWAPSFISEEGGEGVWLEIRDQAVEGWLHADKHVDYEEGEDLKVKRPTNEAAFIRCATLDACKEAFTLRLDRALAAAGIPREEL